MTWKRVASVSCIHVIIYFLSVSLLESKLILTNVLYRHGDRTPAAVIPTDEQNKEETWEEGLGELTQLGVQEEYKLGELLRSRYAGLLNSAYNPKEIYVQSTDVNRCLMSAQAVLNGLYPPAKGTRQRWNESIAWQPIPVHTVPIEYDQLFSKAPCEKLWQLRNNTGESDATVQYVNQTYGNMLRLINHKAGYTDWKMSKLNLMGEAVYTYDVLFIEDRKNRLPPSWVNETVMRVLGTEIVPLNNSLRGQHLDVQRLEGGALVHKMAMDMKHRGEGTLDTDMKMFMYSGHDSTLMPILYLLVRTQNFTYIPYSSLIMLELHERDEESSQSQAIADQSDDSRGKREKQDRGITKSKFYVRLWLQTNFTEGPRQLNITGCGLDCDLNLFLNVTRPIRVADREADCQLPLFFRITANRPLAIFIISAIVTGMLLFLCICLITCRRRCTRRTVVRAYKVHEQKLPEQVPMINSNLSDED